MQTAVAAQPCMASYSLAAFNALPEFDASKTRFPKKAHALDKFAEIIRRYRVQKYLGAALIHKHYPLYDGERMIEEMNANGSVIAPHRGISEGLLTPYLWHLEYPRSTVFQWRPVEFVLSKTLSDDVR